MSSSGTSVIEWNRIKSDLSELERSKIRGEVIGYRWMHLAIKVCEKVEILVQEGRIGHTPLTLELIEFRESPPKDWRDFPTREDISLIHNAIDTSINALELPITN